MQFKINIPLKKEEFSITHEQNVCLFGSCFSDEMAIHFQNEGYHIWSNPFGTTFHPIPMANQLKHCMLKQTWPIFENQGKTYSWLGSTKLNANNQTQLLENLNDLAQKTYTNLSNASHLIITFGTAWGYELMDQSLIVANCHKQHPSLFKKSLTALQSLHESWLEFIHLLHTHFPNLHLIFTVSPVRHIRDGVVENNRSKARLFELISLLEQEKKCSYFPSYEIVMDELRDYRFFKEDFVHPSNQAISYVWERFTYAWISEKSQQIGKEVFGLKRLTQHRVDESDERAQQLHQEKIRAEKERLHSLYPNLNL